MLRQVVPELVEGLSNLISKGSGTYSRKMVYVISVLRQVVPELVEGLSNLISKGSGTYSRKMVYVIPVLQ
ncbi:hypothetical protein K4L44_17445 [Halosquirtibacter laminarini]|uniref:Uncharacterized protein n=1 Tax=Halosquirtibacter laminarini TaxID=3374600 RepID=A0AC61NFE4_9BACT|nr:hypothetical protein K4L44_17445 [Prolixibacteraceae bacterium]